MFRCVAHVIFLFYCSYPDPTAMFDYLFIFFYLKFGHCKPPSPDYTVPFQIAAIYMLNFSQCSQESLRVYICPGFCHAIPLLHPL